MKDLQLNPGLIPQASPRDLEKLRSISGEKDTEMRAFQWLTLAREWKNNHQEAKALSLLQSLQQEGIPSDVQASAKKELEAMTGQGSFGLRFEYLGSRFVQDSANFKMIVPMLLGTAAFGAFRAASYSRLARMGPGFFSQGGGLNLGSAFLGTAVELPVFALSGRMLHRWAGDPVREKVSEDLASAGITLGFLKMFSWAGKNVGARWLAPAGAMNRAPTILSTGISQSSAFLGLLAAHHAETAWGLRESTDRATTLTDILASMVSLGIGGHLGRSVLGMRYAAFQREMELRSRGEGILMPFPSPLVGEGARASFAEVAQRATKAERAGEGVRRIHPLLPSSWMIVGKDGAGGGSSKKKAEKYLSIFEEKYRPEPQFSLVDGQSHAGQVLEKHRRDPRRWKSLLQEVFSGSESLFWSTLEELAVSRELAEITWLHGSGTASLALLPRSGGSLLPTGRLLEMGLAPFSGELSFGIPPMGVNVDEVSGFSMDDISLAADYAEKGSSIFHWESCAKDLQVGMQTLKEELPSWYVYPLYLNRALIHLRRLRYWDPVRFKKEFQGLEGDLVEIKNLRPFLVPQLDSILEELRQPVSNPLTDPEKNWIQESFPLIYGSKSLPARELQIDVGSYQEFGASEVIDTVSGKTFSLATLGGDVQFLFTSHDRVDRVQQWVRAHGYANSVRVLRIEMLKLLEKIWCGHEEFRNLQLHWLNNRSRQTFFDEIQEYAQDARVLRSIVKASNSPSAQATRFLRTVSNSFEYLQEFFRTPPEKGVLRSRLHRVRRLKFTRGFRQKLELEGANGPLEAFIENGDAAEFSRKLERLMGYLQQMPAKALRGVRRVEAYEKPSTHYGLESVAGHYFADSKVVRIFSFSRRTNTENLDVLTHEILGHALLYADRNEEDLGEIKAKVLKAIKTGGDRAEAFYRQFSGSDHFLSHWKERLAVAATFYQFAPDLLQKVDEGMAEVVEELLMEPPGSIPGEGSGENQALSVNLGIGLFELLNSHGAQADPYTMETGIRLLLAALPVFLIVAGKKSARRRVGPYREDFASLAPQLEEWHSVFTDPKRPLRERVHAIHQFAGILRNHPVKDRQILEGVFPLLDFAGAPGAKGKKASGQYQATPESETLVLSTVALQQATEILEATSLEEKDLLSIRKKIGSILRLGGKHFRLELVIAPKDWPRSDPRFISAETLQELKNKKNIEPFREIPKSGALNLSQPILKSVAKLLRIAAKGESKSDEDFQDVLFFWPLIDRMKANQQDWRYWNPGLKEVIRGIFKEDYFPAVPVLFSAFTGFLGVPMLVGGLVSAGPALTAMGMIFTILSTGSFSASMLSYYLRALLIQIRKFDSQRYLQENQEIIRRKLERGDPLPFAVLGEERFRVETPALSPPTRIVDAELEEAQPEVEEIQSNEPSPKLLTLSSSDSQKNPLSPGGRGPGRGGKG